MVEYEVYLKNGNSPTLCTIEDDFEPATESELVAYAKSCRKFWRG